MKFFIESLWNQKWQIPSYPSSLNATKNRRILKNKWNNIRKTDKNPLSADNYSFQTTADDFRSLASSAITELYRYILANKLSLKKSLA